MAVAPPSESEKAARTHLGRWSFTSSMSCDASRAAEAMKPKSRTKLWSNRIQG